MGIENGMAQEIIASSFESKSQRNHDVRRQPHGTLNRSFVPQTHSHACFTASLQGLLSQQ